MDIEAQIPEDMPPAELDRWLSRGWFRSGSLMFRAPVLQLHGQLRQLVQIRVPLAGHVLPRSRRRILRRNRERFRVEIGPARVDEARQRLYERTRERFIDFVAKDLEVLAIGEIPDVFDIREVRVFDGDELVALSYFDVGRRAVSSALGLHDPRYRKWGLGIYTMLEELEFSRQQGARWYYPGYVVPGLAAFDYKLSLGAVQYFDGRGRWRTRARPPTSSARVDYALRRQGDLLKALGEAGLQPEGVRYPAFWFGRIDGADRDYLRGMWHARCRADGGDPLIVEYLADSDRFLVARVRTVPELNLFDEFVDTPGLREGCETQVLLYEQALASPQSVDEAVAAALDSSAGSQAACPPPPGLVDPPALH